MIQLVDPDELADAIKGSQAAVDDGGRSVRHVLEKLSELPALRRLSAPPSLSALRDLAAGFPNFSSVIEYVRKHAALSNLNPCSPLQFPPVILDGPPGIGKTAFSLALARTMGVPLIQLQMSHSTAGFALGGLDPQFSGGGPGYLTRKVALGLVPDPVVLLDEVEKAPRDSRYDPLGPLYSLWEPETACRFSDDGLRIPLNFSAIRWICTTNDASQLHPALLSRCEFFSTSAPSPEQLIAIAHNAYTELRRLAPWGEQFEEVLPHELAAHLSGTTPRDLVRSLRAALGSAALNGRRRLVLADLPRPQQQRVAVGFLR
ncbi:MAG: AAA family ATPase [Caldimonas sp.]